MPTPADNQHQQTRNNHPSLPREAADDPNTASRTNTDERPNRNPSEARSIPAPEGHVTGEETFPAWHPQAHLCFAPGRAEHYIVQMPENAAEACEEFRASLAWWIGKVAGGADATIERRSRARVLEARGRIP
ncbi:hypothetical protein F4861DRAFT_536245 [Xylaria intraflava]|nr:hypothetical protein F4861DRAFT_536245 [Xylaria intraflava]